MERIFHLKENGTSVKTEILAGLTTFMTMAYIIALNPNLLTNFAVGTLLWNGVFLATCIASAIGTVVMAFLANKPFVMAPGMGLNSFFAVIAGNVAAMLNTDYTSAFQAVLCIILVEGIVFLLLSIFNIRDKIVTAIPLGVRLGIGPAIGLMLMNIGLGSNVGIYAEGNGYTSPFYVMRDFFGAMTPSVIKDHMGAEYSQMVLTVITMFIGLFVIILLAKKGVKAAVLVGMLVASVIYWAGCFIFLGTNPFASLEGASFLPPFHDMVETTLFKFDFTDFFNIGWFTAISLIITFCMIDMRLLRHLHRYHLRGVRLRRGGRRPHRPDQPDRRVHVPGLYVHRACGGRHSRCRYLLRPDLRGHPDAPGPEERGFRRSGPGSARVPDAAGNAHLRLHRPRNRYCHDLLHRDQGVLRPCQGGLHPDLRYLPAVYHQVLCRCLNGQRPPAQPGAAFQPCAPALGRSAYFYCSCSALYAMASFW